MTRQSIGRTEQTYAGKPGKLQELEHSPVGDARRSIEAEHDEILKVVRQAGCHFANAHLVCDGQEVSQVT